MRFSFCTLALLSSICLFGQLGLGIVNVTFDTSTRVQFYTDTTLLEPINEIQFFKSNETAQVNYKFKTADESWFQPEAFWINYDFFFFRCLEITPNYYKVLVNNESGLTYWIQRDSFLTYQSWEDFLSSVLAIGRSNAEQQIKTSNKKNGKSISFKGEDCFHVKQVKGDWLEITTIGVCTDEELTSGTLESGWIRWRNGTQLLVKYSLIM